jgi:4'-phosphopantetheinyl transferase
MDRPVAPTSEDAAWVPSGWPEARLSLGELNVWRADLDRPVDLAALSPTERARADGFKSATHRVRWSRSRALLRGLLGGYLGRAPDAIQFADVRNGKPAVFEGDGLEFNLSHSDDLAVIAFARDTALGVDVECDREVRDPIAIAGRVLEAKAVERLRSLPEDDRRREFLRLWVRYEAALKCRGGRLGATADAAGLELIDLDPGARAAAAVALERPPDAVRLLELRESPDR